MVGQNGRKLVLVLRLEKALDRAGRQLCEGRIGWSEDGEWSWTLEGVGKTGSTERRCQGLELAGRDGRVDNVLFGRVCSGSGADHTDCSCCGDYQFRNFEFHRSCSLHVGFRRSSLSTVGTTTLAPTECMT